jgi:hypothetical protein
LIERATEVGGERTRKRGYPPAGLAAHDELDGSIRLMTLLRCGLNRFDSRSVDAFEADVRRAEQPDRAA